MSADPATAPDPLPAAANAPATSALPLPPLVPASAQTSVLTPTADDAPPGPAEPTAAAKVQAARGDGGGSEAGQPSLEEQVAVLRAQLQALLGQDAAASPPEMHAPLREPVVTAKNRRFTAKANPPPAARPPAAGSAVTPGSPADSTTAPEPPAAQIALPKFDTLTLPRTGVFVHKERPFEEAFSEQRRERMRQKKTRRRRNIVLGAAGAAVLLFVGSRLAVPLRRLVSPAAPTGGTTSATFRGTGETLPAWQASTLARLDELLAADRAGRLDDAFRMATALRGEFGSLPGLDLYVANLNARFRRYGDASRTLKPLAGADIPPALAAAASDQLGFIAARERDFAHAATYFSEAAVDDPFRGEYYYHWAQALRRQGNGTQALTVFQEALTRMPGGGSNDSPRDYLAFEMRLTTIELGEGARLKGELEAQLKSPAPSGYWLLTAAALALQEKRLPDAVDTLQRAKAGLPSAQFDELTSDYYFRGFAKEPGLESILPRPDPERDEARRRGGAYFIDP